MVLESLITPSRARKKPWNLFLLGFTYAIIGVILANWVFPSDTSLALVFLTTMSILPFVVNLLQTEEAEENESVPIIKRHNDVLVIMLFLFLGIMTGYTVWDLLSAESIFEVQTQTITEIRNSFSGSSIRFDSFGKILSNNLKVIGFSVLFSFLFGSGAIFILTWNASIIAVAISNVIKLELVGLAPGLGDYIKAVNIGIGTYMVHGIFEIGAYFIAAIAGGIISAAMIRHDIRSPRFKKDLIDSAAMILLSVIVITFAAFIEVSL